MVVHVCHSNHHIKVHLLLPRKPINGLQYLISAGVLQDTPESVAKFLRTQYGLSKVKIGEFLGEISMEFNMAVLEYVCVCVCMCVCVCICVCVWFYV